MRRDAAMLDISTLRPVFFRFGCGRAFSGWASREGDIWAHKECLPDIVGSLRECGSTTLADEIADDKFTNHELRLMVHAVPAFITGEVLEFKEGVECYDYIEAGEMGICVRPNALSGTVQIFLSEYHVRLEDQSNTITLVPHECDEILTAIRLRAQPRAVLTKEQESIGRRATVSR
jgi:hypothetical protein